MTIALGNKTPAFFSGASTMLLAMLALIFRSSLANRLEEPVPLKCNNSEAEDLFELSVSGVLLNIIMQWSQTEPHTHTCLNQCCHQLDISISHVTRDLFADQNSKTPLPQINETGVYSSRSINKKMQMMYMVMTSYNYIIIIIIS